MLEGLATFELIKIGIFILVILCFLCSAIYGVISSMSKNYQQTSGNISTDTANNKQIITYSVNGTKYTQSVLFISTTTNNVIKKSPQYVDGPCTIYYAYANPNDYNVNANPVLMTEGISCCLCIVSIIAIAGFLFLRKHRKIAGVMGGLDIASGLISKFRQN